MAPLTSTVGLVSLNWLVSDGILRYGRSNGVTVIFVMWPEVTKHN